MCCELHVCCNDHTQLFTQLLYQLINITCLLYCTRFWGDENDWITKTLARVRGSGSETSATPVFYCHPLGRYTNVSLVPRALSRKAERGSGVLSNISCHMGWGLRCKECHIYILHPGLEFFDNLDCCTVWFTKAAKFLEKAENELLGKFFSTSNLVQNTIAYVMHI